MAPDLSTSNISNTSLKRSSLTIFVGSKLAIKNSLYSIKPLSFRSSFSSIFFASISARFSSPLKYYL